MVVGRWSSTTNRQKGQPSAYDALTSLGRANKLDVGIQQCIDAACNQWHAEAQKLLLSAASMGRAYSGAVEPDAMLTAARALRVLNQLRQRMITMPLTYNQFDANQSMRCSDIID